MSAQLACKPYEIMVNCVHGEQAPQTERQQQMNTDSSNTIEVRFYKVRAGWYETAPEPAAGVFSIEFVEDLLPRCAWNLTEFVVNEYDGGLDRHDTGEVFPTLADAKRYVRSLISTQQERGW